jgi:Flp pilus assembly protein TadG
MRYVPTPRCKPRCGAVLAQLALCLTILAGVLAVVLDGGVLLAERRRAQATADAAALAAVADLFANYRSNSGIDPAPSYPAKASVIATANANGYDDTNSAIKLAMYPSNYLEGPNAGTQVPPGYAEVIVTYNQARFFSSLWDTNTILVSARAVARGQWVPASPGVLILNPTASASLDATGNGNITVKNAPIIVDSSSSSAIVTAGANAVVTDATPGQPILVTGNPGYSGGGISPTPTPSQPRTADPLRFLPQPTQPANAPSPTTTGGVTTYYPGYYPNGLPLTGGDNVLQQGTYYMNGTFKVSGNASLSGSGVLIYADSNASLSLAGNGSVTLSPPTSGIYQGLVFFQDRTNTSDVTVAGNGSFNVTGTFYAAKATAKVTGNGDVSIGSQFISDQLQNKGAGNAGQVNIVYNSSQVARTRILNLVE